MIGLSTIYSPFLRLISGRLSMAPIHVYCFRRCPDSQRNIKGDVSRRPSNPYRRSLKNPRNNSAASASPMPE